MRKSASLTQRALADKLGRERSFIARIELGERRLDVLEFRQYCLACGTVPGDEAKRLMLDLDRVAGKAD